MDTCKHELQIFSGDPYNIICCTKCKFSQKIGFISDEVLEFLGISKGVVNQKLNKNTIIDDHINLY